MPSRRPAPLSDDLISGAPSTTTKTLLGVTNNGAPLPVKNTFIDVPTGMTPMHMKQTDSKSGLLTAPPNLTQTAGFVHRAMVSQVEGAIAPVGDMESIPQSPSVQRTVVVANNNLPLATPSPTAALAFHYHQWGLSSTTTTGGQPVVASTIVSPQTPLGGIVTRHTLPAGPLTYAMTPTSTTTSSLQVNPQISRTLQYQRPAAAQASKSDALEQCPDGAEDDEGDDDDSDAGQPQLNPHRKMEDAPKAPPGALHPSLGSEGHASQTCKRCCFFPRGRCTNGYDCEFCHYEHEKRKRKNKKKKKKESAAAATAAAAGTTVVGGVIMQQAVATPAPLVTYQTLDGRSLTTASATSAPAPAGTVMFTAPQQLQPCVVYAAPVVMQSTQPSVVVMQGGTQPAPMQTYVSQGATVQGQVVVQQGQVLSPQGTALQAQVGPVIQQVAPVLQSHAQLPTQVQAQSPTVIQQVTQVLSPHGPQAPPQTPPTMIQQAMEPTSPPPLQSPKLRQPPCGLLVSSGTSFPSVPPPMVSPKLPPSARATLG